ncbi:hypothetical protein P8452_49056 [Trifolium repens]|nr:hypothetical protein P8452_49056 [Trifolium repens]
MEGEAFSENPELTNFDLETDDVSDGSNMSSSCGNSNEYESQNAAEEEIVVVRDMTDIKKLAADNFPIADITKYEFVGFVKNDLYNQVGKQRKQLYSDSCGAVKYLRDLGTKDPLKVKSSQDSD